MEGIEKGKYLQYLGLKNNRDITRFLYIEADIGDPLARSGKKSKKGNNYRSERMTCGTHFAAASSTLTRRQGIQRKKPSRQKSRVKKIQEMKGLSFREDDMWDP